MPTIKMSFANIIIDYEKLVDQSAEKSICIDIDGSGSIFIAFFDAEYYQFELIDLLTNKYDFNELTDKVISNNCKGIINGSFFKNDHDPNSILNTGVIGGRIGYAINGLAFGRFGFKAPATGNIVFSNGKELHPKKRTVYTGRWSSKDHVEVYDPSPTRYYFYQKGNGETTFAQGTLPLKSIIPEMVVGCDNLVAYLHNGTFIRDGDTNNLFFGNDGGYPLFGNIIRNSKTYFFLLATKDEVVKPVEIQGVVQFLVELGAQNAIFTDGAGSVGFIYNNISLIDSADHKSQLMPTAIGIKPKADFDNIHILNYYLSLSGPLDYFDKLIDSFLDSASQQAKKIEIRARLSMPFIDNVSDPQTITSKFGVRYLNGNNFHEGVDIRALTPSNIKINADGIVFKVSTGVEFGKFIIVNHGKDQFRTYYFTVYALLSSQDVIEGERVIKNQTIGVTGQSINNEPCLHFELITINKNLSEITYQELLPRGVHLDPELFILPQFLEL